MIKGGGLVASQSIVPNAATTTTPISQRTDVLPILDALQKIPFEVLCPPRVQNARILISLAKYHHSVRCTRGGALLQNAARSDELFETAENSFAKPSRIERFAPSTSDRLAAL